MTFFLRAAVMCLAALCLMSGTAFAQDEESELTINDIAGNWIIEVIDRPDDNFKGSAVIPRAKDEAAKSIMAETITEDKCCGGKNHARVLQDSRITISEDGEIVVTSDIREYLLKIEGVDARYYPDDFELRQTDEDTLIGTANGWTPVIWRRDGAPNIS